MIKMLARRALRSFSARYHYDTGYMAQMLESDPAAFLKFALVNLPAAHRRGIPKAPWWAARIRAALWEDCGPCVQLVCTMALEDGVDAAAIVAIAASDLAALDDDTALALRFTEAVLGHDADADTLRAQVVARWGQPALVSLALAITLTRVYPGVKYALGYGSSCSLIRVAQHGIAPAAFHSTTLAGTTAKGFSR